MPSNNRADATSSADPMTYWLNRPVWSNSPPAPKPAGVYKPIVIMGNTAYVSGHGPLKPDGTLIQGRVGDFIRAPGGRAIHGEYFTHLFYGAKGVARFQVRQPTPGTLRILVQALGDPDPAELERIRRASAEQFGASAPEDVQLEVVDSIEPGRSGKHRFVLPYEG